MPWSWRLISAGFSLACGWAYVWLIGWIARTEDGPDDAE
jgi:hypothetical protein